MMPFRHIPEATPRKAMTTKRKLALTAVRLREVLDYDPLTGIFKWKGRRNAAARLHGDFARVE